MQLADDDSTSKTQLEEEQDNREDGQRVALVLASSDGDAKQKKDKGTAVVVGGVDGAVGQVTLRGSCGDRWSDAGRPTVESHAQVESADSGALGEVGCEVAEGEVGEVDTLRALTGPCPS